jgi:hypothetical protein
MQDLREVTQKPRVNEGLYAMADSKGNFKQLTNKNIPSLALSVIPPQLEEKEMYEEEVSAMVDEDEENKKKEYELIIQQSDGPQTSFFSVK